METLTCSSKLVFDLWARSGIACSSYDQSRWYTSYIHPITPHVPEILEQLRFLFTSGSCEIILGVLQEFVLYRSYTVIPSTLANYYRGRPT